VKKDFNASPGTSEHGGHTFDFGSDADCTGCHDLGAGWVVDIHNSNDCDYCHSGGYSDATEKLGDSITGKSPVGDARYANNTASTDPGDGSVWGAVTCLTCHPASQLDSVGGAMNNHLITIAGVASAHQLSSDSTGGYDCEACHSGDAANEQLNTHMPADTVANCTAICHLNTTASVPSGAVAKTVIDNVTFNDPEPNQNDTKCETCHVAKGDYKRHGLTDDAGADGVVDVHNNLDVSTSAGSADENDCAECHNLGSVTTRLQMHTQPLSGDANDCLTCHTVGGAAQTAIDAGKGAGAAQNCEDCHASKGDYTRHGLTDDAGADGVVDVHDQLADESGTAQSTCSNCHAAGTVISRLQMHTRDATPTTCLTCHQSGAPISTVIADGWGTPATANCDECHTAIGADWTQHNVDHATSRVTADTNCTSCHDGNPGTNTTAPNSVTSPYVGATENHNPTGCYTCHNNVDVANRGTYLTQAQANVKGYVGAMPAGGGDCSACHNAYFDAHVHGQDGGYVDHDVSYDASPTGDDR
jgi:hypothetical protein